MEKIELNQGKGLSHQEEKTLISQYRLGLFAVEQEARGTNDESTITRLALGKLAEEKLMISHFPLVRAVAWDLYSRNQRYIDFDELISAGNEGLVIALRRFDPRLGYRFKTYATWWVRNRISLSIRTGRWMMRIPDRTYKQLTKIMKFIGFTQSLGRDPTIDEIARAVKLPHRVVKRCLVWASHQELSLETPVGDDGQGTLGDLIEDRYGLSYTHAVDTIISKQLTDCIKHVLNTLTPGESKIIALRFGLETKNGESSFIEVGAEFAVSPERVRQIEAKALRKLRHPSRSRKLSPFIRSIWL